jgi:predicted GIY-YIG superfamily endonuclease
LKLRLGTPFYTDETLQMNQKFYYTYILESEKIPNRFYTGFTKDLESRLKSHNHGKNPHTSKIQTLAS